MTAEQLRNSLLQEAIQGKLVPQDEKETASELVLRLQNALKTSSIKKKWDAEAIQEDELPFDIPGNWQWLRLGDIVFTQTGLSYSKGYLEKKVANPVRVLRGGNIQNGSWCIKDDDVMIAPEFVKKDIFLKKNSFITPAVTSLEHLGKTALIREDHNDIVAGGFVLYLMPYDATNDELMEYLAYFFQSALYNSFCKTITNKSGQAFWNISREKLLQLPIPLPPLAEQQRIVAKLEELLPIVEQYGKAQTELNELNAALPSRLRQSILQQAIQGKLVPQDKNETVDELVHSLQRALKESPIKKKWCPEEIQEDELPFDIPDNWKWVRLGDIIYTQTGLSYSKGDLEKKVANPVRVLRGGNIKNGSWCIKDDDVMIAPEFVKKDIFLKKNCFITPAVTSLEHLGKTALIREDHNDIVAGGFVLYLMPYDATNDELMEYLAYFFQSALYNSFCKTITNKSGQAFWNISREKLLQLPIPLPPLAEQQRIVAKIEELFAEIDKLTK